MTNSPTIADLLIATLTSNHNVCTFRKILRDRQLARYRASSIQTTLSRLHGKKYISSSKGGWHLTEQGKNYYQKRKTTILSYIPSSFNDKSPQNTIVAFDIPESNRKIRNWLRNQLKIFNYKMLQQSLWIGPGPLPPLFKKQLNKLEIKDNVKIFFIKKTTN